MRREYELELLSLFLYVLVHAGEQQYELLYVLVHAGEQHSEVYACKVNVDLSCFHYFPTFWCMQVSNAMNCYMFWCMQVSNTVKCMHA